MNTQTEDFEDIFKGIDAALRRAAQTARKLAEQNGTPYVVTEKNINPKLAKHDARYLKNGRVKNTL
jgi:hypothetical protein